MGASLGPMTMAALGRPAALHSARIYSSTSVINVEAIMNEGSGGLARSPRLGALKGAHSFALAAKRTPRVCSVSSHSAAAAASSAAHAAAVAGWQSTQYLHTNVPEGREGPANTGGAIRPCV